MLKGELTQQIGLEGWKRIDPVIAMIKAWLDRIEGRNIPDGKHPLGDTGIFAIVATLTPKIAGEYESHREYIDLHWLWEGKELIRWIPVSELNESPPYNAADDIFFYKSKLPGEALLLHSGSIVVLFPEDAHMPGLIYTADRIRKIVFKIPVELIPQA